MPQEQASGHSSLSVYVVRPFAEQWSDLSRYLLPVLGIEFRIAGEVDAMEEGDGGSYWRCGEEEGCAWDSWLFCCWRCACLAGALAVGGWRRGLRLDTKNKKSWFGRYLCTRREQARREDF